MAPVSRGGRQCGLSPGWAGVRGGGGVPRGAQGGTLSTTLSEASLEGVACAAWAPGGDTIALGRGGKLALANVDLKVFFTRDLEGDARALEDDEGGDNWRVESVTWLRRGAVLATCLNNPVGSEGSDSEAEAESRCATFIVRWSGFDAVGASAPPQDVEVFRLDDYLVCGSIEAGATSPGTGPYLRCAEVAGWGLHAIAHRKSSDCHVSLVRAGAAEADAPPPAVWELLEDEAVDPDKLQAKVPLTVEDEDNFVVGLDVDYTCHQATVRDPTNPGRYLPAGPVLCLLTSDGRLLLYSLAQNVPDREIGYLYPPGFIEPADTSVPPPSPGILKVISRHAVQEEYRRVSALEQSYQVKMPSDDDDLDSDLDEIVNDTDDGCEEGEEDEESSAEEEEEGEGETSGRESSEEEVSSTPPPPSETILPTGVPSGTGLTAEGFSLVVQSTSPGMSSATNFGGQANPLVPESKPSFLGGGVPAQPELPQVLSGNFGGGSTLAVASRSHPPSPPSAAQHFSFSPAPLKSSTQDEAPIEEEEDQERLPQLQPQPLCERDESPLGVKTSGSGAEAPKPLPPLKIDLPVLSRLEGISAPMQLVQEDFMAAVEEVCTLQADLERRVESLPLEAVKSLSKDVEGLSSRAIKTLSTLRGYRQEAHNFLEEHKETERNSAYLKERYKSEDGEGAAAQLDPHLATQHAKLGAEARQMDTHLASLEGLLRGMELESVRKNIVGSDENSQANVPSFIRSRKSSGEAMLAKVQKQHTVALSQNAVLVGLKRELEKLQTASGEVDDLPDAMEASSENSYSESLPEGADVGSESSLETVLKSPWTGRNISFMKKHILRQGSTPRISKAKGPGDARAALASINKSKKLEILPTLELTTPRAENTAAPMLPTIPASKPFEAFPVASPPEIKKADVAQQAFSLALGGAAKPEVSPAPKAAQPPVPKKADVAQSQQAFSLALGGSNVTSPTSDSTAPKSVFSLTPAASDQSQRTSPSGSAPVAFGQIGSKPVKSFAGPATTAPSPFGTPAATATSGGPSQANPGAAPVAGTPPFGQSSSPKALGAFGSSALVGAQAATGSPGFGQPAMATGFGQSASAGAGSTLFSSTPAVPTSAPAFGSSGGSGFAAFSKGSPSGGFGGAAKAASPGGAGFGNPSQASTGFGSTAAPASGSSFGAGATVGGGFGGAQTSGASGAFGAASTFGGGQPAPAFGTATTSGGAGQPNAGAAPTFGTATTPGMGGSGGFAAFGSGQGGSFGAATAGGGSGFGAAAGGSGGFGQGTGGFGVQSSPFGSSASPGGNFGSAAPGGAGASSGMWSARK